ncbi:MAG: HD-GYP domain-containing protein [Bacillota bacterium]|nr:HD-GYP domain-containing protein [Bacillota bacterium]
MHEANKAAENIADEVTRDPQVLLQIAFLKAIDDYTFSHAVHVSIYVTSLGKFLNLSKKELHELSLAGLLHDIGKVDIPPEIVNKPGKLTDEEFKIMKEHVRFSFNRVYRFEGINRDILSAIGQHHERIDGSGYLQKLKGPYIHKWARLLSIADVYDAITTDRVYRNAVLPHEGAEILMSNTGKLDTDFLNIFIRNISFYPTGTQVILSTGENGIIVGTQPNMPLRPIVKITAKDGKTARVVNLVDNLTTFITHVLKD